MLAIKTFAANILFNRLIIAMLSGLGGHAASEYDKYFDAFCKVVL